MVMLISCAPAPPGPDVNRPDSSAGPTAGTDRAEDQHLRSLTDQILMALATRHYAELRNYLPPAQRLLNGLEISVLLLGPQYAEAVVDEWDLKGIEVIRSDDPNRAATQTSVRYRYRANREPTTALITLQFQRNSKSDPWFLLLPEAIP